MTSEYQDNRFKLEESLLENQVVGFDENDNKIVKKRQSLPHHSTLVREIPSSKFSSRRNTGGLEKLTLGLRKFPIHVDYNNKYSSTVDSESPIFSDYDDTDLNPNILVIYLNRQKQKAPSKNFVGTKNFKKIDSPNSTNTFEDTIENDYKQQKATENNMTEVTQKSVDESHQNKNDENLEDEDNSKDIDTTISKMSMQCLLAIVRCCDEEVKSLPLR